MSVNLSDRVRPDSEAAPWVVGAIKRLESSIARETFSADTFRQALHEISLCSRNSMSSKEECGRIAREALDMEKRWGE
jgi:hypothetical protein